MKQTLKTQKIPVTTLNYGTFKLKNLINTMSLKISYENLQEILLEAEDVLLKNY